MELKKLVDRINRMTPREDLEESALYMVLREEQEPGELARWDGARKEQLFGSLTQRVWKLMEGLGE